MLMQIIIDTIVSFATNFIYLLPRTPPEWALTMAEFQDAMAMFGSSLAKFGVFVPLDALAGVTLAWLSLVLTLWIGVAAVRLILWVLGR